MVKSVNKILLSYFITQILYFSLKCKATVLHKMDRPFSKTNMDTINMEFYILDLYTETLSHSHKNLHLTVQHII